MACLGLQTDRDRDDLFLFDDWPDKITVSKKTYLMIVSVQKGF